LNYRADYLLDKKVPGIVKGTARMVDTEAYFTNYELYESSMRLDLVCNNSNNLEVSVGYKSPMEALAIAEDPIKEVVIWSGGDAYPKNSFDYKLQQESSTNDLNRITKEWNLLSIGFDEDEYVKADERIWYLRIKDTSGGPYGYEKNIIVEVNGTQYSVPEFIPNIHHIEEFKLVFNKLIFETMLYPFFDGSREIVVPIRGVNHELALEDEKTALEINGMNANSWSATTPGTGSNNMWVIVCGTANYDTVWLDFALYPPMSCRSFILGCAWEETPDEFDVGIMDYGWRVAYCMDGNEDQTDIPTCTKTDDNFLEDMFAFADSKLGSLGKLIVFEDAHGLKYWGHHVTPFGTSHLIWWYGWINVVRLSEYENMIDDITSDGTHVLMWIHTSFGEGLNEFSPSDHNYNLECWSLNPRGFLSYLGFSRGGTEKYTDYCWSFYKDVYGEPILNSAMAFFFWDAYEGTCQVTVSESGVTGGEHFNDTYSYYPSYFYIQKTWGNHYFYVNWGY